MAQVMVCTDNGKQVEKIEYVFIENGKQVRGRPARSEKAFLSRLMTARKDSKGRYNASKNRTTYIAQVLVFVDGTKQLDRIADPR